MLWSSPSFVHDIIHESELILFFETHKSFVKGLPTFSGFTWISTFRALGHTGFSERGSGGVAFLVSDHLLLRISTEGIDTNAQYIWISLEQSPPLEIIYYRMLLFAGSIKLCYS